MLFIQKNLLSYLTGKKTWMLKGYQKIINKLMLEVLKYLQPWLYLWSECCISGYSCVIRASAKG